MHNFTGVLTNRIPVIWPLVKEMLRPAVEMGFHRYTLEEIEEKLNDGEMQLWVVLEDDKIELASVTTIYFEKNIEKICEFLFIGGRMKPEWVPYHRITIDWAKANGCTLLVTYCRPGMWKKYWKDWDLVEKFDNGVVLLWKELIDRNLLRRVA